MNLDRQARVLVLEPSGLLYGSERALLDLLPPLKAKWDITVCCPPGLFAEAAANLEVAVRPSFTPYLHQRGRLAWLGAAFSLRRVVRNVRPDLIHVNQAGASRLAVLTAGRSIPIVVHTRLFEDYEYLRKRALEKRVCAIGCVSDAMLKDALEILDVPGLFRLYDPYTPTCSAQPASTTGQTLICVGRLSENKGQDLLLHAIAELRRQNVEVEVTFIGSAARNSRYGDELKEMSRSLGIEAQVQWLGFKKDVFEDLRGAAAVLVPSEKETLGRVLFEAWDAGTVPIVWVGSGGAAEAVAASGGGTMFQERTPASLAEAIRHALDLSQAERRSLVGNGRAWMAANCHPITIAGELSKIWRECIQRGKMMRDHVE